MKVPDFVIPIYDARRFSWDCRRGSAEASDLNSHSPRPRTPGTRIPERPLWYQVWNDSADVGFNVRSHRTGRIELFTMIEERRGPDHETMHWTFAMASDPNITITILND